VYKCGLALASSRYARLKRPGKRRFRKQVRGAKEETAMANQPDQSTEKSEMRVMWIGSLAVVLCCWERWASTCA
jgi:hypothetical protein